MGRRKGGVSQPPQDAPGQLDLIEVTPENLKAIKPVAKAYAAVVKRRVAALAEETDLKEKILSLINDAKLSRLADGTIRFRVDGMTVTVTPRDELVRVKNDKDRGGDA